MPKPIMPMATAIWLVEETALTFEQIADFCELHILQVRGIADGEVAANILKVSPIDNSQLTADEIKRCEKDSAAKIRMNPTFTAFLDKSKKNKSRYTPVARRQNKPDAIAWLVKNYPEITDGKIIKLIGTTKKTIQAIRDKSHWNFINITPKDPVLAGFCSQNDMNKLIREVDDIRERLRIRQDEELRAEGGSITVGIPQSLMQSASRNTDAAPHDANDGDADAFSDTPVAPEEDAVHVAVTPQEEPQAEKPEEKDPLKAAEQLFAKFGNTST